MAKSTVLNEFFNVIKFKTDQASLTNAQTSIMKFKSIATKALGFLGVGFSLSWLKGITEEFNGINDSIRGATEDLGEQSEIQKKILASAQDCRESYGKMAEYVDDLVMKNQKLFPVDDAVKFTSLMEKLEKGSGKESNLASTMSLFSKATTSGSFDKSTFTQLAEKAPEVINTISEATGKSKKQLESMAAAGTLSISTVKNAIFSANDAIQKKFDGLDLSVTDAITHIRNSWGYWFEDIDSTYKLTDKFSRLIINFSDKFLSGAKKVKSWLDEVARKMGGYEKLLKLIAMAAAAVFIAMNATAITKFLECALGLLGKINLQTALAAAKWLALFLIIEDIWTFFQGGDSVIGRFLKDAGVDVDKLREDVENFFADTREIGADALEVLGQFWDKHGQKIVGLLQWAWNIAAAILQTVIGFFKGILDDGSDAWDDFLVGLDKLGETFFGPLWDPLKESAQSLWDFLTGLFDWFGEKVEWARGLWNGIKSFFDFGNEGDSSFGGGKTSGGGAGRKGSVSSSSTPDWKSGGPFNSPAWGAGQSVSPKAAGNSPVTNNKNVSIKQENNQQYTFKVDSTTAADKLRSQVDGQSTQSANDLARVLNFGR